MSYQKTAKLLEKKTPTPQTKKKTQKNPQTKFLSLEHYL